MAQAAPGPGTSPGSEDRRFVFYERTRELEERLKEKEKNTVEVPEESVKTPPAGEEIPFQVDKINIVGNTVVSNSEIRKITSAHEGKQVTLSQAKAIGEEITKLYRTKGYLTCRAYIPPQKLETKTLEIVVLEGKLGDVQVRGNKYFQKENLTRKLSKAKAHVLEYGRLVRDVARMNLHPDREVKAVIVPGSEFGVSDLMLDVEDHFPLHIGGEVNNFGTKLTGQERYNIAVRHTNLTRRDDILGVRMQFGEEVVAVGTQYALPVGEYNTQIGATFNYTDVGIGGDFSALDIAGEAYTYSLFFNQPFVDNPYVNLTWTGSFASKDIKNETLGRQTSKDKLRMLRTGLNADLRDKWGRTFLVNDFTFGVPWLDASHKNDPGLSRANSGASFTKYNLTLNRIQPLRESTFLYIRASAQLTPDPLVSAEQFDMGGAYSVRGYPQSDYLGDVGGGASVELRVPFYFIPRDYKIGKDAFLWNRLNWVAFVDHASGRLRQPGVGEDLSKDYLGAGGGLRFDFPNNWVGRFEWAAPFGDRPTDSSNSQFYFTVSGDFV